MNKTEQDLINIFHSAVPAKSSDKMEQTIEHKP